MSVTRGQCDARPMVTFPTASPLAGTKLYCLVTEAHVCYQLAQGCTRQRGGWDSNPRPADRKSGTLPLRHRAAHAHRASNKTPYKYSMMMIVPCCLPRWLSGLRHSAHRPEQSAGGAGFNPRVGGRFRVRISGAHALREFNVPLDTV